MELSLLKEDKRKQMNLTLGQALLDQMTSIAAAHALAQDLSMKLKTLFPKCADDFSRLPSAMVLATSNALLSHASSAAKHAFGEASSAHKGVLDLKIVETLDEGDVAAAKKEAMAKINSAISKIFKERFKYFTMMKDVPQAMVDFLAKRNVGSAETVATFKTMVPAHDGEAVKVMEHKIAHLAVVQMSFRTMRSHEDRDMLLKQAASCVVAMKAKPLPAKLQALLEESGQAMEVLNAAPASTSSAVTAAP